MQIRCDLGDDVDRPHDPPCKRCGREGIACTFPEERQAGKRSRTEKAASSAAASAPALSSSNEQAVDQADGGRYIDSHGWSACCCTRSNRGRNVDIEFHLLHPSGPAAGFIRSPQPTHAPMTNLRDIPVGGLPAAQTLVTASLQNPRDALKLLAHAADDDKPTTPCSSLSSLPRMHFLGFDPR